MNKKTKLKLNETLDKALEPPRRKDVSKLDLLLSPYDVAEEPVKEPLHIVAKEEPARLPTNLPTYVPTNLPNSKPGQSVAPEKDFSRVPNSIKRFVEAGKFPNSSLAIYLYLYSLTRGGIQPKRSVRVNKAKLLVGANLRAEKALHKNLAHLKALGLVKVTIYNGDHLGNEYEVFVPEEIEANPPTYLPTKQPTYLPTKSTQVPTDQTLVGRWVETKENKTTYGDSKTISLKQETKNDDEPFGAMLETLRKIGKGKSENWRKLAELLEMEFEIAKARTDSVSDAPAFLTEHLRRKLQGKREISAAQKKQPNGALNPVGIDIEASEAEPLTIETRKTTLATFKSYIEQGQEDFILSQKENYTSDDWTYLMNELKGEL